MVKRRVDCRDLGLVVFAPNLTFDKFFSELRLYCSTIETSYCMSWLQLQELVARKQRSETYKNGSVWQNLGRIRFETFQEEEYTWNKYSKLNIFQFKWNRNHSIRNKGPNSTKTITGIPAIPASLEYSPVLPILLFLSFMTR